MIFKVNINFHHNGNSYLVETENEKDALDLGVKELMKDYGFSLGDLICMDFSVQVLKTEKPIGW